MNAMPDHEVMVLDLAGQVATLACRNPATEPTLHGLGFVAVAPRWKRPIRDEADRKQLAAALIGLDGLFAEGAGWSPAELLYLYRERNTITTAYRTISWTGSSAFCNRHHAGDIAL